MTCTKPNDGAVVLFTRHKLDREFFTKTSLGVCLTCGGAEASLPTHCPQKKMGAYLELLVSSGTADFRDGRWVETKVGTSIDDTQQEWVT